MKKILITLSFICAIASAFAQIPHQQIEDKSCSAIEIKKEQIQVQQNQATKSATLSGWYNYAEAMGYEMLEWKVMLQDSNALFHYDDTGIMPPIRPQFHSFSQVFDFTSSEWSEFYSFNEMQNEGPPDLSNIETTYSIDSVGFFFGYSRCYTYSEYDQIPSNDDIDTITVTIIGGIDETESFEDFYTTFTTTSAGEVFQQSIIEYHPYTHSVNQDSLNAPIYYTFDILLNNSDTIWNTLDYSTYYVGNIPQLQNITSKNIGIFFTYKTGKADRNSNDFISEEINLLSFAVASDPRDFSWGSENALSHTNTSYNIMKFTFDENSWFHNRYASNLVWNGPYMRPAIGLHVTVQDESIGVEEYENTPSISIFPNPANAQITISGVNVAEANVYNLQGQLLLQERDSQQINVEKIPSGMYILRVVDENGETSTVKFSKM